ncbi:HD domain-containing phosphohydrolase [Noviherbaspirillum sedimenti]|uniref:Response regulator n=1 Tax=Noviherbaspirillum sedimenti TaxID=2320865 RepID=A0A3A3G082_9BURK|nr:HD domain-containing phosphohydrolase [Noviherbaspirillum sedimenti]RJG01045.1 response regulator [Noviherbaspirillum sedimenti]
MTIEPNQLDDEAPSLEGENGLSGTLLFVDDEPNILSSLRRLFRPSGYRVLTAESGAEGLAILEKERVDLVISDMRMPHMNGAQFLEQVVEMSPDTVRILLTGHADIGAVVEAINKGRIYRYVAKPWEENDILLCVRHALERQKLERETRRLQALTRRQNDKLRELNASLEEKVRIRTEQLRQVVASLEDVLGKLKKGFLTSVRVFSNLIEMREPGLAGHAKRVADLARMIAQKMNLTESEVQDVFLAGLLHDIGKIGLSDKLLARPWSKLSADERVEHGKHAVKGEASLMALEQLHDAAKLIRNHHERFDGLGYPDGLAGAQIPAGARILAVANDFDAAQIGTLADRRLSLNDALQMIIEGKGKRYDPAVVDLLIQVAGVPAKTASKAEIQVRASQLMEGMALSRDLVTKDGMLLLSKDYVLDQRFIEKIQSFERADGQPIGIYIYAKRGAIKNAIPHHAG